MQCGIAINSTQQTAYCESALCFERGRCAWIAKACFIFEGRSCRRQVAQAAIANARAMVRRRQSAHDQVAVGSELALNCPLQSGPKVNLDWTPKETNNGQEARA